MSQEALTTIYTLLTVDIFNYSWPYSIVHVYVKKTDTTRNLLLFKEISYISIE